MRTLRLLLVPVAALGLLQACSDEAASTTKKAALEGDASAADGAALDGATSADGGASDSQDVGEPDSGPDVPDVPPDVPQDTGPADTGPGDTGSGQDSKPSGTAELIQCLTQFCPEQIGTCLGDDDCGAAVGCLSGCAGDTGCMLKCGNGLPSGAQQELTSVAQCAGQQGCIKIPFISGNCGNGKCDFGEQLTCAKDCGTASAVCGDGKCDLSEGLTCAKDCAPPSAKCGDGTCDGPLENPLTCAKDCPAPKCADGKCEAPWETALTCPADCSATAVGTCGDGACDGTLENPFTCAKDCPAPKCGDAKCEAPFETFLTCAQDCNSGGFSGNLTVCVSAKCFKESLACAGDFKGCGAAAICVGGCKDLACVIACGDKLTGGSQQKFQELEACVAGKCTAP